jgi:hypothetical protein
MRVPGLIGSLGAGVELQESSAILFSSRKWVFFTLLQLEEKS